jgi:serine O-acetyltransferase
MVEIVETLRAVLLPGHFGNSEMVAGNTAFRLGSAFDRLERMLRKQIRRGRCVAREESGAGDRAGYDARADTVTGQFLARLPSVRQLLATDVQAAYEGDPAATCPDEAIFC